MVNKHKTVVTNLKKSHCIELDTDGVIISKWILKK